MAWLTKGDRNLIRLGLFLTFSPFLYWQLNKIGYIPPINYWIAKNNSDRQIQLSASSRELLNYGKSLSDLISAPVDRSQISILKKPPTLPA